MKRGRVVLVAGPSADAVDPVREALERNGVFAVVSYELGALLSSRDTPNLVIVCYAGSPDEEVWHQGCPTLRQEVKKRIPSNAAELLATADQIAHFSVPVVVVHERPTVEDVNHLRSCGACYVIDRRADESCGWRRLLACVAETLAA
jgi:hypothetical protein